MAPSHRIPWTMADRERVMTTSEAVFSLSAGELRRLAESALNEDCAVEDVTTAALVPDEQGGRAAIVAKGRGVLAGLPVAEAVFAVVDGSLVWRPTQRDGDRLSEGDRVADVEGSLAAILRGERVALNYLSCLSGVATATAAVVEVLQGTGCRLRDTRKTAPGLRSLEKQAVRMGGGTNHRLNLGDGVLIKDNHLAAMRSRGLGIADALKLARGAASGRRIEIEVATVDEARQALGGGADEMLLDNMSLEAMREVVALAASYEPRTVLEASGGITLANARATAETGVEFISMGAITHSAGALDVSLEVEAL